MHHNFKDQKTQGSWNPNNNSKGTTKIQKIVRASRLTRLSPQNAYSPKGQRFLQLTLGCQEVSEFRSCWSWSGLVLVDGLGYLLSLRPRPVGAGQRLLPTVMGCFSNLMSLAINNVWLGFTVVISSPEVTAVATEKIAQ